VKFGVLRWLAPPELSASPRLGLVWCRTANETHNADGEQIAYLRSDHQSQAYFRELDPVLYQRLGRAVAGSEHGRAERFAFDVRWLLASPGNRTLFSRQRIRSGLRSARRGDHSEALTLLNWPDALVRIAGPGPACHIQADSGAKIRRRHLVCHWPRPRWFDCQRAIVECAISPDSLYWCATGRPRRQVVFARLPRSGPPTGSPPRRSYRRRHRNSSSLPPRNRRQSLALRTPCGRPIQLKPQSCSAAPLLPRSAGLPIFKVAAPAVEPLVRGCLRTVRRRLPRHGQR
jgi:hypothetical protein